MGHDAQLLNLKFEAVDQVSDLLYGDLVGDEVKGVAFPQVFNHLLGLSVVLQMSQLHLVMIQLTSGRYEVLQDYKQLCYRLFLTY